ncbi:MAG: hypothetical protein LBJ14_08370 [Desulfarculales bacterium]|jgi:methionine synthase II (cobalamin-independent)|nr:hypothetical protein [Desulfarculales bacterium]
MAPDYNFVATAIGSLPHSDVGAALDLITQALPEAPFWPQLVNRSSREDMLLMYSRALAPLISANPDTRSVEPLSPGVSREEALALFYQNLWEGNEDNFILNETEASGFQAFTQNFLPSSGMVKGQVTGPITLASAVIGSNGKALLYDEEIAEAMARGLGAAAAVQARILGAKGARPIIFFDEPSLTGFGSAFSPLTREQALRLLRAAFEEARVRQEKFLLGLHCCGNTDWSLIMEAGPDIISLDSAGYGSYLLLYFSQLQSYLAQGGGVAWGAVPTDPRQAGNLDDLWLNLKELLDNLVKSGINKSDLAKASLITPACGLGSLNEKDAGRLLNMLTPLSRMARAW